MQIYADIERAIYEAQRDTGMRGILPRDIVWRMRNYRAEGTIRRLMMSMACEGRLVRMYGATARRGYRLPTAAEQAHFRIWGNFPPGACNIAPSAVRSTIVRERRQYIQ